MTAYPVDRWMAQVAPVFGFLREHGFDKIDTGGEWPATWVRYLSDVAAVEVIRSVEFDRVEVELIELIDGQVSTDLDVRDASAIHRVLLDMVALVRLPGVFEAEGGRGLEESDIEPQLIWWADTLRSVAPEFLEGDTGAVAETARYIWQRTQSVRESTGPRSTDRNVVESGEGEGA